MTSTISWYLIAKSLIPKFYSFLWILLHNFNTNYFLHILISGDTLLSASTESPVELFHEYSDAILMFASISCILFMIVGVPGNLITIAALAKCKKVSIKLSFLCNTLLSEQHGSSMNVLEIHFFLPRKFITDKHNE